MSEVSDKFLVDEIQNLRRENKYLQSTIDTVRAQAEAAQLDFELEYRKDDKETERLYVDIYDIKFGKNFYIEVIYVIHRMEGEIEFKPDYNFKFLSIDKLVYIFDLLNPNAHFLTAVYDKINKGENNEFFRCN